MGMSVGSIVSGAFRLLRERPGAVAAWGLVYLAVVVGMLFATRPYVEAQTAAMTRNDPAAMMASMQSFGVLMLANLVSLGVFMVLFTAAMRAVLRPLDPGFAYLRVGMDELRVIALSILFLIGFYFAFIIAALVVALVAGIFAIAGGAAAGIAVGGIGLALLIAAAVWIEVRLSLVFPLTLIRGRFVIGESWRLTKGRFWTLFGAYLVLGLVLLLLWIAVAMVTLGSYWTDLMQSGFTPEGIQAAARRQMERQLALGPVTILGWFLSAAVGAGWISLFGGASAIAARALANDPTDMAGTFS